MIGNIGQFFSQITPAGDCIRSKMTIMTTAYSWKISRVTIINACTLQKILYNNLLL